jgi:hypothetical protein
MARLLQLTDGERLAALGKWLATTVDWLERERRDSRSHQQPSDDDIDPEHRVEAVTFFTAELDATLRGMRRAATMLEVLAAPMPGPISDSPRITTPKPKRPAAHLRVVK